MTPRPLTGLCITIMWLFQTAPSSSESEVLSRHVALDGSTRTSVDAMSLMLAQASVPGGIISVSNGCTSPNPRAFPLAETTLKDGLDYVSTIDPARKWSYGERLILIGMEHANSTILNTVINDVEIQPGDALTLSTQRLVHTSEVQASIQRAGLEEISPELGFGQIPRNPKPASPETSKPIHLHQVTLVKALNTLALTKGTAVWEYEQSTCNGKSSFRLDWVVR